MSEVVTTGDLISAANWNGLAFGVLGYAEVTADQTGIGTEEDLTGLSVTVDVEADRRIKITAKGEFASTSTASIVRAYIKEGSTYLQRWAYKTTDGTNWTVSKQASVVITPSSGSHTYKLTAEGLNADVDLEASSTEPAWILVEDIGST